MNDRSKRLVFPEWDPLAPEALENQRCVYNNPRDTQRVAVNGVVQHRPLEQIVVWRQDSGCAGRYRRTQSHESERPHD